MGSILNMDFISGFTKKLMTSTFMGFKTNEKCAVDTQNVIGK